MAKGTGGRQRGRRVAEPRPEYVAAVRYRDGSRDLFHVKNADDIDDARRLVYEHLVNVLSVVISPRICRSGKSA